MIRGRITPTEDALYRMVATELFAASSTDKIGIELELGTSRCVDGAVQGVPLERDRHGAGILDLLTDIADSLGGTAHLEDHANISVKLPNGGAITLEPAGQIEYSGPPLCTARQALDDLASVRSVIEQSARRLSIDLWTDGFNTAFDPARFDLVVAKPRYLAMDSHFADVGSFGRRMMRATCSLQINLDFGRGSEAQERWRLANMIAPSLNALFANSPARHNGRDYKSFRAEIWRQADPTRTGRLYDCPDLDPVADYLRFALNATVMMIERDGVMQRPAKPTTYRAWMLHGSEHGWPDWTDWRLHLTTLFPDVRARGWMELRSIDALDHVQIARAVALTTTLIYNPEIRAEALERLENRRRVASDGDHEHGGYWSSDLETGYELLAMARGVMEEVLAPTESWQMNSVGLPSGALRP
jgi:glutamate--cysteine ligase